MLRFERSWFCWAMLSWLVMPLSAAELARLDESNWDRLLPAGKEVDAIYDDFVLRNDQIVVVIANPIATRNANMTVRDVGGCVIDLTRRDIQSDQLSCFYPGAGALQWQFPPNARIAMAQQAATVGLTLTSPASEGKPEVQLVYSLTDGQPFLQIATSFQNPHAEPIQVEMLDAIRADRSFSFELDAAQTTLIFSDDWWRQAYAVVPEQQLVSGVGDSIQRNRPILTYSETALTEPVMLEAGAGTEPIVRRLIPAANTLELASILRRLQNTSQHDVKLNVVDAAGPIENAQVLVSQITTDEQGEPADRMIGSGRTDDQGNLAFSLPVGNYELTVSANGRPRLQQNVEISQDMHSTLTMELPGYVQAKITCDNNLSLPVKVQFIGTDGTPNPDFGPDTEVAKIRNLVYSANGVFRQEILPGSYQVIISRGNEYDAVFTTLNVQQAETATLTASLQRVIDSTGWLSSDFHSHSTPSGDNTSSQRGRVLNLLAEQIEFAPCTEHNRISTYVPHLEHFGCAHLLATCSGMELTGQPLPVNHQNAFPLVEHPRTQDGGGPVTDENPVVQIERLAMWDNNADKVVQTNHPNLMQILGDRDLDQMPDGGFEKMFGFMDVIEVHPPSDIFQPGIIATQERRLGNVIFNWLQLLNLDYRIPGVVNTDAHYNFHGSGWLRNYMKLSTDDPSRVNINEVIHACEHGHIVMTNGPFLTVQAKSPEGSA
ncbi:MAG: CehA/McbA family metallohydrolase, partial [Planctomycetales bacterium]|nr:CehA/McbA family metallohydrolase [Planctomycetales bacterium]